MKNIFYRFPKNFSQQEKFIAQVENFSRQWNSGQAEFEFHTSGSTGTPKKLIVSRRQMMSSAEATIQALNLSANQTALVCLDITMIAGAMMMVRAMIAEMTVYITPPTANPLEFLNENDGIDFAAFVPYQLKSIMSTQTGVEKLNKLKVFISGGAPLPLSIEEKIRSNITCQAFQTYGMTETVSHIALRSLTKSHSEEYTVLPGVEINQDARGCLIVTGAATNFKPIITNDLVKIQAKGRFKWLGRVDNVINSGGVKVHAEKVETAAYKALHKMMLTRNVLVLGKNDPKLGQKTILLVEGAAFNTKSFADELSSYLNKYEYPKEIIFLDKFPLTLSGKINRQELEELLNS